jgi:hypothetical protein
VKFKVYTSSQKRRFAPQIKREFKRRAAIEHVGHLKEHQRLGRNYLVHVSGDATNAVLATKLPVTLTARPPEKLFHLVFESYDGMALVPNCEEKRTSLKAVDLDG